MARKGESGGGTPYIFMSLKYESGEEIRKGDRVLFHGEPGEVDFVVDGLSGDADMDWYFTEFGPGVMVLEPRHFGSAYVHGDHEDLVFVSRAEGAGG